MKLVKRVLAFGAAFSLCAAMAVSGFALDPAAAAVNQQQAFALMQQGNTSGALAQCEQGIKNLEGASSDDLLYQQYTLYLLSSNLRSMMGQFQAATRDEQAGNQLLAKINIDNLSYLSADEKASMKEIQAEAASEEALTEEELSGIPESMDPSVFQKEKEMYEGLQKWPAIAKKMLSERKVIYRAMGGYISVGSQGISIVIDYQGSYADKMTLFSQPVQIDIEGDLDNRGCIHIKAPAGTKVMGYVSMSRDVAPEDFEKYYSLSPIDNDSGLELTVEAGKDYELVPLMDDTMGYWSMVLTGV